MKIRTLKSNEIEIRVGQVSEKGFSLLLYKEARADMDILDETFGALGWKREHVQIGENIFCKVSVWNESIKEWVSKMDVGSESKTEAVKGQSSDSFKRACVNWGIGRELYTTPFIWIPGSEYIKDKNGKKTVFEKFVVKEIESQDGQIKKLKIVDSKNKVVFEFHKEKENKKINFTTPQNEKTLEDDKKRELREIKENYIKNLNSDEVVLFANYLGEFANILNSLEGNQKLSFSNKFWTLVRTKVALVDLENFIKEKLEKK